MRGTFEVVSLDRSHRCMDSIHYRGQIVSVVDLGLHLEIPQLTGYSLQKNARIFASESHSRKAEIGKRS